MHVFGLTGGIGSGKSSVAARFRERGFPVVDADVLARDVVAQGSPGLARVVEAFGPGVLDSSGSLDRAALAALVFRDPAERARLNAIVHPLVREASAAQFAAIAARGEPLACYEVPLLYEVGLGDMLKPVVVVAAQEPTQIRRASLRDGSDEEAVRSRIRAQLPLEDKVSRADYVIRNDGTIEELRLRADDVLDAIARQFGVDPGRYPR